MSLKSLALNSFLMTILSNQIFGNCILQMDSIVNIGKYAPSSHNAQMWKIDISSNSIHIGLDSMRLLDQIDPINREAWISIGAFTENCILFGYDLGYDYQIQIGDSGPVLTFIKKKIPKTNYCELILKRKTIRKQFDKKEISPFHQKIIENFNREIRYFPFFSEKGRVIAKFIYNANFLQLNDTGKLHELSKWIIASKKENKERLDGLAPSALGLSKIKEFFYYLFFNKRKIQTKSFISKTLSSVRNQVNSCSGYIIITSTQNDLKSWIESGQLLQKLWLKLTEIDICVHPMNQPIEENTYNFLKTELGINTEIQMILRVGYLKKKTLIQTNRRRNLF